MKEKQEVKAPAAQKKIKVRMIHCVSLVTESYNPKSVYEISEVQGRQWVSQGLAELVSEVTPVTVEPKKVVTIDDVGGPVKRPEAPKKSSKPAKSNKED